MQICYRYFLDNSEQIAYIVRREPLADHIAARLAGLDRRRQTGADPLRLSRADPAVAAALPRRNRKRPRDPAQPMPRRRNPRASSPAGAAWGWSRR